MLSHPRCALGLLLLVACARGEDSAGSSDSTPVTSSGPTSFGDLPPPIDPTSTTELTSSTSSTTSDDGSSGGTTGSAAYCGNGAIDPSEECDYGDDNSDVGPCTHKCTKAVCGDGNVWEGVEACDMGAANSKDYGGCALDCQWASRCGDGLVDVGYEDCDQGALNGSGREVDGKAPCTDTCRWIGRVVFLSGETFSGNLGGVSGADLKCRTLAQAADLAGANTFRAWISDGTQSPLTRFTQIDVADAPYILLNGRIVAGTFTELVEQGPRTGISITETGEPIFESFAWTNTSAFGEPFGAANTCAEWTSSSQLLKSRRGLNAIIVEQGPLFDSWRDERLWTSASSQSCNFPYHLYCFQDG